MPYRVVHQWSVYTRPGHLLKQQTGVCISSCLSTDCGKATLVCLRAPGCSSLEEAEMGKLVAQIPNEDPERIKRVLDAKWRTIGIDKDALAQQVEERKAREQAEKERDEAFAALTNYWDDQLKIQQQDADRIRKQAAQDMETFRQTQQMKHTRKEWDINRPDHKTIDHPARVGDNDPRLGPSSMQLFEGEDLSAGDRKREQLAQSKAWWEEQAAHKAALKAQQLEAEKAYGELLRYQDMLQLQNKFDETAARREMDKMTQLTQLQQAQARREEDELNRLRNLAANAAEIQHTLDSALMTEDPNQAASAMSAYRVRKDHYKGMSKAEQDAILATQLAQMEELKARAAAQAASDAAYARAQQNILRAMDAQARHVEDFKKQQLNKASQVLQAQREEKIARDKALADLYANKVAPEYFLQFGTSHR